MNSLRHMRAHDHIMHLSTQVRGATKVSRKATMNFAPAMLFVEVIGTASPRAVILKQLYIAGKPQMRDEVPVFMLAKEVFSSAPQMFARSMTFNPLLDPIHCGDEIVAEFESADDGVGATYVDLVLSGHLEVEMYLKRLADTGTRVRQTMLPIAEREGETVVGPATLVSKNPNGTTTVVMREHPYELFRPEWFAVSPECAPFYEIVDLRLGKDSFFQTATPIAASLFPPLPTTAPEFETFKKYLRLDMPVISPGIVVALTVQTLKERVGLQRPPFRAALHGISVDP
jgi:hypothetical protein